MRVINSEEIKNAICNMCISANTNLQPDIYERIKTCSENEKESAKNSLKLLLDNADYARENNIPICQDTGMAIIFAEVGQDVHIEGNFRDAVNQGVREGYEKGYLRKSVVADPLKRINTKDNTPAIIHYDIVPGDKIKLTLCPKGFGSENMSGIKMLKPSQGRQGVIDFVVETVKAADANPCPPIVIGVGIGGDFEYSAVMAKKALTLPFGYHEPDEYYYELKKELLCEINKLNIGPLGYGGNTTALALNILTYPTHIAGLPVAVNISCHVTRHEELTI